jgi:hypothetical protein
VPHQEEVARRVTLWVGLRGTVIRDQAEASSDAPRRMQVQPKGLH